MVPGADAAAQQPLSLLLTLLSSLLRLLLARSGKRPSLSQSSKLWESWILWGCGGRRGDVWERGISGYASGHKETLLPGGPRAEQIQCWLENSGMWRWGHRKESQQELQQAAGFIQLSFWQLLMSAALAPWPRELLRDMDCGHEKGQKNTVTQTCGSRCLL